MCREYIEMVVKGAIGSMSSLTMGTPITINSAAKVLSLFPLGPKTKLAVADYQRFIINWRLCSSGEKYEVEQYKQVGALRIGYVNEVLRLNLSNE